MIVMKWTRLFAYVEYQLSDNVSPSEYKYNCIWLQGSTPKFRYRGEGIKTTQFYLRLKTSAITTTKHNKTPPVSIITGMYCTTDADDIKDNRNQKQNATIIALTINTP